MMRHYLLLLFLFVCPLVFAQPAAILPAVQQKIQALTWLTGKWQGTLHITGQDGIKQEFKHNLEFAPKLKNSLLLIDEWAVQGNDTVLQNIGILGYNALQPKYTLQAYTKDGAQIDAEVEVLDKKMVWRIVNVGYMLRYTATLNPKGQWYQIGEVSTDEGKRWTPFFESTLNRIK